MHISAKKQIGMSKCENKNITSIVYNHLNLPIKIIFGTGYNIAYTYDATGVKLKKIVTTSSTVSTTEYLSGFQYRAERKENSRWLFLANEPDCRAGVLQHFPTAEGYVEHTLIEDQSFFNYVYNYTDHLGNIRLSYTYIPDEDRLGIVSEEHYYPPDSYRDGLKHGSYNSTKQEFEPDPTPIGGGRTRLVQVPNSGYQYQYNGKEWQDELGYNMYDMDMRQYDPAIARWIVQDPVVHHSMSPYNAFDNNPVFWADPSGADSFWHSDFMNQNFGHWTDQYRNDSDTDSNVDEEREEKSVAINSFIKFALNSDQNYNEMKIFSGENDEVDAYNYMRDFANRYELYEIAAWVTRGSIYVLPVSWDNEFADHSTPELIITGPERANMKDPRKKVVYAAFLKHLNNTRVQILAEVHTHYLDESVSSDDVIFSRANGVLVFDVGPRETRVTNGLSYVYDDESHGSTTKIFNTNDILNGNESIRHYSLNFLREKNLLARD